MNLIERNKKRVEKYRLEMLKDAEIRRSAQKRRRAYEKTGNPKNIYHCENCRLHWISKEMFEKHLQVIHKQ